MARSQKGKKGRASRKVSRTGAEIRELLLVRFGASFHSPFRNGHFWRAVRRVVGMDPFGGPLGLHQVVSTHHCEGKFLKKVRREIIAAS